MNNYYRIGDHLINIITGENGFSDPVGSFAPFATEKLYDQPVLFTARIGTKLPVSPERNEMVRFEWEESECTIYDTEQGYETEMIYITDRSRRARMVTDKNYEHAGMESEGGDIIEWFFLNNFLMMLYAFASAKHKTVMFHASTVTAGNRGFLFLGHSGTGKSTHSRLWLENITGCKLLNDDNPLVRITDGKVKVYGSPWSGKTRCYINQSVEAGAFVILEQAHLNEITRLKAGESLAVLMAAASCLKQDENVYDGICDTLAEIVSSVRVFRLKCLPDREAARLCHSTLSTK